MAERAGGSPIHALPRALDRRDEIRARIGDAVPAIFLDYDGTLAPIVADPREALLPDATRRALERLRDLCPTAIVSGRGLADVRGLAGVDGIHYAGSHGFEVTMPDGSRHVKGEAYRPALDRSAAELERRLEQVTGAWVERKAFAIAVHYRRLRDPSDDTRVERAVDEVLDSEPELRKTRGKKILELRPALDWDKGKVVLAILESLERTGSELMPIYVGDDVTDEDAFAVLGDRGIGIVVEGEDDRDSGAAYALGGPEDVCRFLVFLADLVSERRRG